MRNHLHLRRLIAFSSLIAFALSVGGGSALHHWLHHAETWYGDPLSISAGANGSNCGHGHHHHATHGHHHLHGDGHPNSSDVTPSHSHSVPTPAPESHADCPVCLLIATGFPGVQPQVAVETQPDDVGMTAVPQVPWTAVVALDSISARGPPVELL
jgi:hypothetical protein